MQLTDGNVVHFVHGGLLVRGVVNGKSEQEEDGRTYVPVYVPSTDKQLLVETSNVMEVES